MAATALEAAIEGRRMDPGNTEIHHQIAAILRIRGARTRQRWR